MKLHVGISETGFWSSSGRIVHVCCTPLCDWIISYLSNQKDKSIYDFGCGLGQYCKRLHQAGYNKVFGFEGKIPRYYDYDIIHEQDLTQPFSLPEKGNVIFLEVAEHVPAQFEDSLLQNISDACDDKLIMSWAVRGQKGTGHVNCLDNDEVIERIEKRGFKFLSDATKDARSVISDKDICSYFNKTTMIFQK